MASGKQKKRERLLPVRCSAWLGGVLIVKNCKIIIVRTLTRCRPRPTLWNGRSRSATESPPPSALEHQTVALSRRVRAGASRGRAGETPRRTDAA